MMRGKIFLILFALPFFGVGAWMGYSIGSNMIDAWQMKQWVPVDATLRRAGYETHTGDDSDTHEAYAQYSYSYGGQLFVNDRVAIAGGADNIGSYQQDLGSRLGRAYSRGESITVYVNPKAPAEAIVDRSLRWGLVGFKSIFLFVFGGVGLGLLIFLFRSPKEKDLSAPKYRDNPWLANDDWQTPTVKSDSKKAMHGAWLFAAFWNLISAPLPFVVYAEVTEKNNWPALFGLLFPVVGIGLIAWAVRRTLEWNRFGAAPVILDPFPGAIGGHVGGTIDINLPYDSNARFSTTLTNLHSYISGSGKNRSRKESAEWQDTQIAHTAVGPHGTRLSFRFEAPDNLTESSASQDDDDYYIWRLNVSADVPGTDFDRDYEIPVYPTGAHSTQLSDVSIEDARVEQEQINLQAIEKLVNLGYGAGGRHMKFPMGRNLLAGFGGFIFGSLFGGAGWYLLRYEDHLLTGGVFGLVGLVILLSSLYFVLNALEVVQEGGDIRTIRRVLGVPIKRRSMRRADFARFTMKASSRNQSGSKHVIHYSVYAVDRNGHKLIVGEGFRGASEAAAAADLIAREFALTPQSGASVVDADPEGHNFLAAD